MNNQKGISLVQVILAAGMLGGLSLALMQFTKTMTDAGTSMDATRQEQELKNEIRMILNNEDFCSVSLAGDLTGGVPDNPPVFNKELIDEDDEGLDISLWYADSTKEKRSKKRFNGKDNTGSEDMSTYGKITILSMKLIMNNPDASGNLNFDYPDSPSHKDTGIIKVIFEKKLGKDLKRNKVANFPISLQMRTGEAPIPSGQTELMGCKGSQASGDELACQSGGRYYDDSKSPPCQMSMNFPHYSGAMLGGGGGSADHIKCPPGMAITGLRGRSGSLVDAFGFICKEINPETLEPMTNGNGILIGPFGSRANGTAFGLNCGPGQWATGLQVRFGSEIDAVGLRCDTHIHSASQNTPMRGGGGGTYTLQGCLQNTLLRGFNIRHASRTDAIQSICW